MDPAILQTEGAQKGIQPGGHVVSGAPAGINRKGPLKQNRKHTAVEGIGADQSGIFNQGDEFAGTGGVELRTVGVQQGVDGIAVFGGPGIDAAVVIAQVVFEHIGLGGIHPGLPGNGLPLLLRQSHGGVNEDGHVPVQQTLDDPLPGLLPDGQVGEGGQAVDIGLLPFVRNGFHTKAAGDGALFAFFRKFQEVIVVLGAGEAVVPYLVAAREEHVILLVKRLGQDLAAVKIPGGDVFFAPGMEIGESGHVGAEELLSEFRKDTELSGHEIFQPKHIVTVFKTLFSMGIQADGVAAELLPQHKAEGVVLQAVAVVGVVHKGHDAEFHGVTCLTYV